MNQYNLNKIINLRHELHAHPELSMEERWTKAHLMNFLKKNTNLEIVDCGLWFYAVYRAITPLQCNAKYTEQIKSGQISPGQRQSKQISPEQRQSKQISPEQRQSKQISPGQRQSEQALSRRKGPIAFRGEFDAIPVEDAIDADYRSCIPGVGHKCGHDGHASILAGLALEVAEKGADRDVYFIFQHAEETGQGGQVCAELISNTGIEEIYACHNMSGYPAGSIIIRKGTMWCASKGLSMHFEGLPSHASLPENGHNPALCIAKLIEYLHDILLENEYTSMVLGTVVGVRVGAGDFGVSPGDGELSLTLRGENEYEMLDLEQKMKEKAESLALLEHLTVSYRESDVFPETRNDDSCVDKVVNCALALAYPVIQAEDPVRSSEDFGHFTKACPGAIFLIGNGEKYPPIHTPEFDYRDDRMEDVVDLFYELIK